MYIAGKLAYHELQKTGGTHICRLLERYAGGTSHGKHNRPGNHDPDTFVVGSIRNPWDWYVSLWAFGVSGRGAVHTRTIRRIDLKYYLRTLPRSMDRQWLSPGELLTCIYRDAFKPTRKWRETYLDASSPAQFRCWLKMLLDPDRRFDIGEGYAFSPLSKHAGLLTFRYFRLYTPGNGIFTDQRLAQPETLVEFDRELNITHGMIRTESLEEDFVTVVQAAGLRLSVAERQELLGKNVARTNKSERRQAHHYYDDETIALIQQRDAYIIRKYGYHPPTPG
jgi:hypothetical protein